MNPLHLCGECSESGPVCCDQENQNSNCDNSNCQLRWVLSVQPHGAPALDVEFPQQAPIGGDSIVFILNDDNPFRMELTTWTVSGGYCYCMYNLLTIIYLNSNEINAHTLFSFVSCCDCQYSV